MTRMQKWFVIFCFIFGLGLVPIIAQLQQSGGPGSSVTLAAALPAGTNQIGHVIVDTAPTTAVTGTFWQSTQPVSLASLPALAAGSNTIGKVTPVSTCGTTAFTQAWAAVPTSATSITATTTCVQA